MLAFWLGSPSDSLMLGDPRLNLLKRAANHRFAVVRLLGLPITELAGKRPVRPAAVSVTGCHEIVELVEHLAQLV